MTTATVLEVPDSPLQMKKNRAARFNRMSPFSYLALVVMVIVSCFPFYWMFICASSNPDVIAKVPPAIIPGDNFMREIHKILSINPDFPRSMLNTLFVAGTIAVTQVIFSSLAGFAFAKLRFKGKARLLTFIIITLMLPAQLGLVPLFKMMGDFHWIDSYKALFIPGCVTAFGVFWMRQVIDSQIPKELIEAASIDGASVLRTYRSVIVPAILPSAFVLGLFSFLASYNDFLWPLLVLQSPKNFTVQVAITNLNTEAYGVDYNIVLAGSFLATVPLLILFIFVGRRMVTGVMEGAVKG